MRMKQLWVAINAPLCFGLIVAAVQKNSKDLTMQEDMRSHIMGGRLNARNVTKCSQDMIT